MVYTSDSLDEMARLIEDLEGLHEALPMLIFIAKISLHQARVTLRTEEDAFSLMREVEVLNIDLATL